MANKVRFSDKVRVILLKFKYEFQVWAKAAACSINK